MSERGSIIGDEALLHLHLRFRYTKARCMEDKRKFLIILVVILAAIAGYFGVQKYFPKEEQREELMTVEVFFNNSKLDPEISCNKVFPVEREIPKTQAVARAALEELLKGATDVDKEQGFSTSVNPDVKIQSLSVENGVARVDFNEQLEFQVGGSCRVSAIRAQITQTLKQFPTVNSVIISIDGRTEDILQP